MATQPSSQRENDNYPTSLGRPWKVIATELTEEHDSDKFLALCEELSRALDERQLAKIRNLRRAALPTDDQAALISKREAGNWQKQ